MPYKGKRKNNPGRADNRCPPLKTRLPGTDHPEPPSPTLPGAKDVLPTPAPDADARRQVEASRVETTPLPPATTPQPHPLATQASVALTFLSQIAYLPDHANHDEWHYLIMEIAEILRSTDVTHFRQPPNQRGAWLRHHRNQTVSRERFDEMRSTAEDAISETSAAKAAFSAAIASQSALIIQLRGELAKATNEATN